MSDNTSDKNDSRKAEAVVNSIDFLTVIDRLPTYRSQAAGIYLYGADNNYPYKMKQLALRSNSLKTAQRTFSKFTQGLGFPGATPEDVVNGTAVQINRDGLTAYDLLKFGAREKSGFNWAVHVNYNALGQAVELNPIPYEFNRLRIKDKNDVFEKFIITNVWHYEYYQNYGYFSNTFDMLNFNEWVHNKKTTLNFTALEVFAYNPDPVAVREQIRIAGGIDKYPGQLFYKKDTVDIYQLSVFDSVIDDAQVEAEAKLYSISNLQNSFNMSGVFNYPANIDNVKESKAMQGKLQNAKGSVNAGRFIAIPRLPGDTSTRPIFESIQQNNVDNLFKNQREDSKKNIYELYEQPSILNGRSDSGMFNQQSMEDAFKFYNAVTAQNRMDFEIELNTLFQHSIIDIELPIKIEPLNYGEEAAEATDEENEAITAESQARLKGTVGGVQGILQIQQSVSAGTTQYDAGLEILKDIYGYDDSKARAILGEPVQKFPDDAKTVD